MAKDLSYVSDVKFVAPPIYNLLYATTNCDHAVKSVDPKRKVRQILQIELSNSQEICHHRKCYGWRKL